MQDEDSVRARLRDLEHHLRSLPDDALVVYEDAGFHVAAVSRLVRDALVGRVDVHSMNEDELQAYAGRQVDLLDAAALAPALRAVQSVVPVRTLVVHTRDWSLALGADARRYRRALEAGTVLAGTRYRYGDDFTAADHERVSMRLRSSAGTALARQIEQALPGQVCCVPSVDVACSTPTTVGLGDAYVGGFVGALVEGAGRTTTDRHPVARWE
jgi:ADP-dependent phosphofructokinase/glucokinase